MDSLNNIFLLKRNGVAEHLDIPSEGAEIYVLGGEEVSLEALVFSGTCSVHVVLTGAGAVCHLRCVYLAGNENKAHIHFDVRHQAGDTVSTQIVKGIVTDNANVSFEGTIRIPPNAQKCDASQNHRSVVLSNTAQVKAVPELEIYADDVKCAHGSAIGALDEKQLFYMMSRGLTEEEAKNLLLQALVKDVLSDTFDNNIIEWMKKHV